MGYLDPYVLPADTVITPLSTLSATMRREIDAGVQDYAVTRPWSRLPSTVVDAQTAALLERFREPKTIVDAVVELSLAEGLDARAFLSDAARMVRRFADEGVIAPAGSPLADRIVAELSAGDRLGQIDVDDPVQVLVDVEVHRGHAADGTPVAVKLTRRAARPSTATAMLHEARVLDRLAGRAAPEMVASGDLEGRPWIATRWCQGLDAATAAAGLRGIDDDTAPGALHALADAVLDAYGQLHAVGVVHGDVHPRNLVVSPTGSVSILDFAASVLGDVGAGAPSGSRPGIDVYAEPELAEAVLAGAPLPAPTPAGEQFALGVLLFVLLVGHHPYGPTADPDELLRRILNRPPSFDEGLADWAGVDHVIRRAMEPRPADRHASTGAMLHAFRAAVAARPQAGGGRPHGRRSGPTSRDRLLTDVLDRLAPRGARFEPSTSAAPFVMHGLAGRAWAMLRCAESREDPELLAVADLWAARAAAYGGGNASLLHGSFGIHAVRLAVARARADDAEQAAVWGALLAAASAPPVGTDVTHGRAGVLLGCSGILPDAPPRERGLLVALADGLANGLAADVNAPYGVAHGTAGRLLSLLRWAEASGTPPRPEVAEGLDSLATAMLPTIRGYLHTHANGGMIVGHSLVGSWCNGGAGLVHVWLTASRVLGDARWQHLAEQAGTAIERGSDLSSGDLCCGLGGQAYALLALHRASGEVRWLESGRRLADGAAGLITRVRPDVRDSLYAGEPGIAALAADLAHPNDSRMPLVGA